MRINAAKISDRIEHLVRLGVDGLPFWDLCCDHGYIGIHAFNSGRFSKIYFVDSVEHIVHRLDVKLSDSFDIFPSDKIEIIHAKAELLSSQILGSVVIAGVGGRTILKILNDLTNNGVLKAQVLILSAHTDELLLTDFLKNSFFSNIYELTQVFEVIEGRRLRKIFFCQRRQLPMISA